MERRPSRRRWWWPVALVGTPLGLCLAAGIAAFLRLEQGPIDVAFLVPQAEAAINADIAPLSVTVSGADIRYDEGHGAGVVLANVRVRDAGGNLVASAPSAALGFSWWQLLTGHLAPRSIALIEPRVRLALGEQRASDAAGAAGGVTAGSDTASASVESEPAAAPNLTALLRDSFSSARSGGGSTSSLASLSLRSAVLEVGPSGKAKALWRVPELNIRIDHRDNRSIAVASGTLVAPSGPVQMTLTAEEPGGTGDLQLVAAVSGLVPADLASLHPAFGSLSSVLLPVEGDARVGIGADGGISQLDMNVGLGKGQVAVSEACAESFKLDRASLHIAYVRGTGRIELLPSELSNAGSSVTLSGLALVHKDATGSDRWQFNVDFADARLADTAHQLQAVGIDSWTARGTFTPSTGETVLDKMEIKAGTARLVAAGRASREGVEIKAGLGAFPAGLALRLWPVCFQSYARNWILDNVQTATIAKGQMRLSIDEEGLGRLRSTGVAPDDAAAAELGIENVSFTAAAGLPAVTGPSASVRFAGRRFEATMPEAAMQLPSGLALTLTEPHYTVEDFLAPLPRGRIELQGSGPIAAALELMDSKPLGLIQSSGLRLGDLRGAFSGNLTLDLPLTTRPGQAPLTLAATSDLTDVSLVKPAGGLSVQGGTIKLTASEKDLSATGDVLVNGVAAKLSWSRVFAAPREGQPPLRIEATLDASDRDQLGLSINHMVDGNVPVTLDVAPTDVAEGASIAHVEADLTEADLVLDTLAWRKRPGEPAHASFDILPLDKGRTRLDEFKLSGDRIAIGGSIELGKDNKLTSFHFPDFSVNLVTRLDVSGQVRPDRVLEVRAHGSYFDGRDFFRALFSAGQITERPLPPPKATSGLELTADIDTILGYSQVSLHGVHMTATKRQGRLTALRGSGTLDGGGKVGIRLDQVPGQPRYLLAEALDAGQAFRLVGMYQSFDGGEASLRVNLDAEGNAEKTGTLWVQRFALLGDPVVKQVLSKGSPAVEGGQAVAERSRLEFDRLRVQFAVGQAQLVLREAFLSGPVLGATMRGRIDYGRQQIQLGGTYIPLYGLNSMFGALPLVGQLLVGRNGEGLLGITFAVNGPLADPEVLVNPVSAVAPGIFRQIFEIGPDNPTIQARPQTGAAAPPAQSSSLPPMVSGDTPTDIGEAFPPQSEGGIDTPSEPVKK